MIFEIPYPMVHFILISKECITNPSHWLGEVNQGIAFMFWVQTTECSVGVGVVGSVPRVTEWQSNSARWLHPRRRRRVESSPVSAVRAAPGVDMGAVTLVTSANTNKWYLYNSVGDFTMQHYIHCSFSPSLSCSIFSCGCHTILRCFTEQQQNKTTFYQYWFLCTCSLYRGRGKKCLLSYSVTGLEQEPHTCCVVYHNIGVPCPTHPALPDPLVNV